MRVVWKARGKLRTILYDVDEIFNVTNSDSRSTIFDIAWAHAKSLSPWPPSDAGGPLSTVAHPGLSGLEGSGVCIRDCAKRFHCALRQLN